MKILLSIKPEFVEKIFSGEKKFEFRKAIFQNKAVDSVVVYSTMPEGRIIGEFSIEEVITDEPAKIWSMTKKNAGITKDFFDKYFDGRCSANAIKIGTVTKYNTPIDPFDIWENFVAPQSFKYLHTEILSAV